MTLASESAHSVPARLSALLGLFGLALGGIFFIPHPFIGLLLWGALLLNPSNAIFALLGLCIGATIKRLLRISDAPILGGGLKANGLLAAVVGGWMTGPLGLAWGPRLAIAAAAAVAATLIATALMRLLSKSIFPPLLWGYCIVAAMLFSVCPTCTVMASNAMPPWPIPYDALSWAESLLRSIGSLMYAPDIEGGVLVCLAILIWSRTMFVCGVVGWISGIAVAVTFQNMHLVYYWLPVSYNFFITGMALGAVIFLPGRLSLLVAAAGGCAAAVFALVLQYAMNWSATSYLPISSSLAIWVGIGAFTRDRSLVMRNILSDIPPEEKWWRIAYWYQRFGPNFPLLAIPVAGELVVSQGFNGPLSHMGTWAHALDFQRPPALGSIWGAEVTAPAAGVVERVKNFVPDNALGGCNYAENWGNYVVIRLDTGGWVLLAHLQQNSITVAPGGRIEVGSTIGRVGNSGRSPIPHLHLHLQSTPLPGSSTNPFRLANFFSQPKPAEPLSTWNASSVPDAGALVMAATAHPEVYQTLVGTAPGSAVWTVESQGKIPRALRPPLAATTVRVTTQINELGQHVFSVGGRDRVVIRLDPDAWRVIDLKRATSPFLRLLALACPSIPYAAAPGKEWTDLTPNMPSGWLSKPLLLPLAPYVPQLFQRVDCVCVSVPTEGRPLLHLTSHPHARSRAMPIKVHCELSAVRGPTRIHAEFHGGSVTYTLLSFEPSPPGPGQPISPWMD